MTGRAQTLAAGLLLLAAFFAGWTAQGWRADAAASKIQVKQSSKDIAHAQQGKAATENKAGALLDHGRAQQENTHDYSKDLALLQAGRAADATRIASLQHDLLAAATRHARVASDAAACRDLANRHQKLSELAGEGAELVIEAGRLVEQRDAEIGLLIGQVTSDRELIEKIQ